MSGYTRQQTYIDGDTILAEHTNDEFDLLAEVFSTTLGHKHDGTVAEGPTIDLLSDDDGDTKIQVEEGLDDDTIRFDAGGVEQMTITGSKISLNRETDLNFTTVANAAVTFNSAALFNIRPQFDGGTSGVSSPFTVDSTFKVTNLNCDLFDDLNSTQFLRSDVADSVDGVLTYTAIPAFNGGTSGVSAPFTVDSTFKVTNLNADLLDGLDSTQFLRSDISSTYSGGDLTATSTAARFKHIAITDAAASLLFDGDPGTGFSGSSAGPVKRITCNDGGGNFNIRSGSYFNASEKYTTTGDGATQIRLDNEAANGIIRLRTAPIGTADTTIAYTNELSMSSTVGDLTLNGGKVWHAGNDGAGSGLDADTLDGVQGSNYARTDVAETFNATITISSGAEQLSLVNNGSIELTKALGGFIDFKTAVAEDFDCRIKQESNGLGFTTGGDGATAERLRIDSTGNVGIGVVSPTVRLEVSGQTKFIGNSQVTGNLSLTASGNQFVAPSSDLNNPAAPQYTWGGQQAKTGMYLIADNSVGFATAATERMRISSAGDVTVGTSTPSARLSVLDSTTLGSTTGSTVKLLTLRHANTNAGHLEMFALRDATGSTWTTAQQRMQFRIDSSYMGWIGYNGSGNENGLAFGTGSSGVSPESVAERVRITATGNVGIGTTAPLTVLDVNGTITSRSVEVLARNNDTSTTRLWGGTVGNGANLELWGGSSAAPNLAALDADNILFRSQAGSERARIAANGNVGIGTTDPLRSLHINKAEPAIILDENDQAVDTRKWRIFSASSSFTIDALNDSISVGSIGYQIDRSTTNVTTHIWKTNGSERVRINSAGDFLVGTTNESLITATTGTGLVYDNTFALTVARADAGGSFQSNKVDYVSGTTTHIHFRENGTIRGSISSDGSTTSYNTTSDYRLKENVVDLTDATSRLKELPVHRFNFIGQEETIDGFLAHEVQAVVPEAVTGEKDGEEMQQMDASKLVPLLTAALKETTEKLENVVGRLAELEVRIQELEGK